MFASPPTGAVYSRKKLSFSLTAGLPDSTARATLPQASLAGT